jgi:hypothetical protein
MGERDFKARYRDNKREADSAARSLENGELIEGWRYEPAWIDGPEPPKVYLYGRAWVAWLYEIALENANTLVQVHGPSFQDAVEECERLVQEYKEVKQS